MADVKKCDDIYFTVTMAEVLEKQGHLEDALTIYKILSDTSPGDESLKKRIAGLKEEASKRARRRPAP